MKGFKDFLKENNYGFQANTYSKPIPKSIPKKYHKYISDIDDAGVDEGKNIYTCVGIAFEDANTEMAKHSYSGTVSGFLKQLRQSEICKCDRCIQEKLDT